MKNFSKRFMAGFLATVMFLAGVVIIPKTTNAEDAPAATVYFDTQGEYKISDYWTVAEKKVPLKPGYVFGGWYKEDKETPLEQSELTNDSVKTITAIAKFVPAAVLSIKTQAALGEESSSLRILSSVDSLKYQEVGLEYKLGTLGEAKTGNTKKITQVYSAIKPYKGAENLIYPSDTFVKDISQYFIAVDVSGIKNASYEKIVYARPYWVTMDGTEVMGLARNNRIVDKQNNNQYTSVGINLLTDGKTTSTVAAGRIKVTYNSKDYDVVGATADISYDSINGGKYRFPEMECYVDEGDDIGTITFVGNADIQGENLENLLADGLLANVRFVKTSNVENPSLDFEIKATEFGNWEEALVTDVVVQ